MPTETVSHENDTLILTDDECTMLGREFLKRFMTPGFGAPTKREMEIFMFHLLSQTSALKGKSNYEIANALKLLEPKVKALRLEAALKYQPASRDEALQQIARLFFTFRNNNPMVDDEGNVTFSLDDPVLRREFENAVKGIGYFVDTSFNREIVKVKASVFLAVFAANMTSVEHSFVALVNRENDKGQASAAALDKTKPWYDRVEAFLGRYPNTIDALKNVLAIFSSPLETAASQVAQVGAKKHG